ncbi:hypothetical protein BST97_12620 [Nonlabens spongiae]|uniref:Uncharacterized protein n=1 Tax=Nonlabens spongiae TaxID=331648 RepID=A0A1W6MMQ4_9FLAO|nr:hypothetical protein [Nonlabens spongiae]ARN78769.1 hypothetical protein BST97_12620 [Nonlabens spongiae]
MITPNLLKRLTVFLGFFMLSGCFEKDRGRGISININDSKKRGVFITEYEIKQKLILGDSIRISPSEVWLEKVWRYDPEDPSNSISKNNNTYQVVLTAEKETPFSVSGLSFKYTIGVNSNQYLRKCGETCLIGDLAEKPGDTLLYKLKKGAYPNGDYKKEDIFAELMLIKK